MTSGVTSDSDRGHLDPAPRAPAPLNDLEEGAARIADLGEEVSGVHTLGDAEFAENSVALVDARGLHAMGELAAALSYLWVELEPPGPQQRGRLGLYLEEAIEQQLEERGALAPGIQASTGLDASLSDQLYRARLVEMRGIALGIPSLEGITNLGRSLDAEDSAVLRWWIAAAADRPVRLVISNENTKLRVYPSPVLFETLYEVAPEPVTPMPPSPSMANSSQSMDLSDLPPEVTETNVLGTKIASLEALASDCVFDEDQDDREEDHYHAHMDVDLSDLDRALGLSPPAADARALSPLGDATLPASPAERDPGASRRGGALPESPQLPLDYESPRPSGVLTQGEGERHLLEAGQKAAELPAEIRPLETHQAQANEVPVREVLAVSSDEVESSQVSLNAQPELDDDLDAEEFLRTLKEDSSKAPQVSAPDMPVREFKTLVDSAPPRSIDPELVRAAPEPLPTKKIARNPFIRMAEPAAGTLPNESSDEEADFALDRNTIVDLPAERSFEATLSGAAAPDPNDPFNQLAAREWKTWVKNLEAARGPKPLAAIERMFVTDYTRLREAVRRGVADVSANEMLSEWQTSFSKSYSEAFDALRVRGKRPTMVLDIPELATRLGRLHGAKRVQLLLVDGLRFDLGLMVQDRMRETADAALTERLLLWSALPSVTSYQLELLGRGADGLKQPGDKDEPPTLVSRGAAARVPRRIRTGTWEVQKLDVVEDCLRQTGAPVIERMDAIADETASAIVEHLAKQPPRTMVVTFGDHGFALDPSKAGTTAEVSQGGSSPEEVLVPAFAWLTGAVH